ncbi:acyl-CoA reductase [candidate division GN15 bacterium]|nr:acyl-CoA reductase [candidate division GN15 bacterium]
MAARGSTSKCLVVCPKRRSAAAATPMPRRSAKVRYKTIAPREADEAVLLASRVLPPFSDEVLAFVDDLSNAILQTKRFKQYPEVMAMAFWMRRANILDLKKQFEQKRGERTWLGRGIVFHIAPSNVDTIFVYSWFLSMLVGNRNIVRVSSATNEQLEALVEVINDVAADPKHTEVRSRFMIVQYEHNDEITGHFSATCHTRVIWGGDETIRRIRAIPLGPAATEMVFADKFSFAVIGASAFLEEEKPSRVIERFYNDAYWFNQNACSSPRLVVWVGNDDEVARARESFWAALEELADKRRLNYAPAVAMNKLIAECAVAINATDTVTVEPHRTSFVNRVLLSNADDLNRELQCGGGLFYEMIIPSLDRLAEIVDPKDQTIVSYGIDRAAFDQFVNGYRPQGINRIVPFGEALTFSAVWDGYDLLREFCRDVDITVR